MDLALRDPIELIKARFRQLKARRPELTLRAWAVEFGMDSPEVLVLILQRKKALRLRHAPALERALDLDPSQSLYFRTLIQYATARDEEERRYFRSVLDLLAPPMDMDAVRVESDELFAHWIDAALTPLSQVEDLSMEAVRIAERLVAKVDTVQIGRSIEKLVRLRLLQADESGRLRATRHRVSTRTETSHAGARAYYRQVSELASAAADFPLETREFQCFAIGVRQAELPRYKELLRQFRVQLAKLESSAPDVVYQANIQFFPLSRPPVRPD
jgi:uncharacterized protein (TIGR02147 family)